ncbi:N-6 DNA methylase [Solibacillus sp. FSL R7-0668]|uniref:N-6 DNA methylase n=1 Tax=Solibacillus sp. FSL R7-0668 TaxID=2921688 RepID=UPI0030F54987
MEELGRYYTQDKISHLLISQIEVEKPKKVLELGIGNGSLSLAAFKRWGAAEYSAIDIDFEIVEHIRKSLNFVKVENGNVLDNNLNKILSHFEDNFDLAICNPPYLKYKPNNHDYDLLDRAGFESVKDLKNIPTDLMFLVKNLIYLKDGSELAIILPDSLLTNHTFQLFRADLLKYHKLKKVIQLPDKVFQKTEARTHILIIEKGKETFKKVILAKSNLDGVIINEISVNKNELIQRMDYDYHFWKQNIKKTNGRSLLKLKDMDILLKRGNKSKKYLDNLQVPYFHTSTFEENKVYYTFPYKSSDFPKEVRLAEPGDILVARVGKRCIGKVAFIEDGFIPVSDCVYLLRIQEENSLNLKVLNELISTRASLWFQANAHGVCARVISKTDFLDFEFESFC